MEMSEQMMRIKRIIMWTTLIGIILLTILSAIESFAGARSAKLFFTSPPMVLYWGLMALLFASGFVAFSRIRGKLGLFLMHAGCLLVIIGSMWSSEDGHRVAKTLLGRDKIQSGLMAIPEGVTEDHVFSAESRHMLGALPFGIRLNKFSIEYYESESEPEPTLFLRMPEGTELQVAAATGNNISLGEARGTLTIVRTFGNLKIHIDGGEKTFIDEDGGDNPAVEVSIERADGTRYSSFAFQNFQHPQKDGLEMVYRAEAQQQKMPRRYLSDLTVVENGKDVAHKIIRVNDPLHFGGYHFYQSSYDLDSTPTTILSITSDSGLYAVFTGYLLLCLGAMWQFWVDAAVRSLRKKRNSEWGSA